MIKSTLSILFFILIAPTLAIAELPELPDPDLPVLTNPDKEEASAKSNPNDLGERATEYKTAINKLKSSKSIKCYFPQGVLANWQGESLKLEEDRMSNATHFDNIDISGKGRARLIGNMGATDVLAVISPTGITFIEYTDVGNVTYTTVFPSYLGNKKINSEPKKDTFLFQEAYIAVFSRHIYAPIIGAMPSQFHGYCRILE
ncbi:hypothetical protein FOG18_02615 [Legionella israelensis]|uniref:hypothetical protein n=1 Tax=Legionella israelensis TaxID=454 RepID=UPI00117DDA06|nr:hypothetical protein [Legionella israelensis]QDP71543.1 hypothetical protein FOG18_02615 [Legionella israelensis]